MNRRHPIAVCVIGAAAILFAISRVSPVRADEDDEHPITSNAASVTHDAAGHVLIGIKPATQKKIGLRTEALASVTRQPGIEAYGYVLDPAPLAALDSNLVSARAALQAASAEYRRSRRLYHDQKNASLRALQGARAAFLSDRSRAEALEQRMRDAWGPEIADMNPRARAELIAALIARRRAIVRVSVPAGAALSAAPRSATVRVLGHERNPIQARTVYAAPMVDQAMQGQAFLLVIARTAFLLRPGAAVSAELPASGRAERGVIVPRSAVVRYAGKRWVYCALDGDRFVRREIEPVQADAHGYFVTVNLAPGTRVVVTGAQMLLSQELKARIQMED